MILKGKRKRDEFLPEFELWIPACAGMTDKELDSPSPSRGEGGDEGDREEHKAMGLTMLFPASPKNIQGIKPGPTNIIGKFV